jgi:hypothetical protein
MRLSPHTALRKARDVLHCPEVSLLEGANVAGSGISPETNPVLSSPLSGG